MHYEIHWRTTDIIGGKLVAVTVPAMNAYAGEPLKFPTAQAAHRQARAWKKQWGTSYPYTAKRVGIPS